MDDVEMLRAQVKELKCACDRCSCEKDKLGVMYEECLKEKAELERKIEYLEGMCDAYKYCIGKMGR